MEIAFAAYLLIGILFAAYKMREWLASLIGEVLMFAALWLAWPLFVFGLVRFKTETKTTWTARRD